MRAYLAGPRTEIPDYNRPAFRAAKDDLEDLGYDVLSPLDFDDMPEDGSPQSEADYLRGLEQCVAKMCAARIEVVIVLPGWERSRGAVLEVQVAGELGKRILRYPDLEPARHPGSERFHAILRSLGMLHDRKQQDYGRDDDPFANVRASSEWGIDGWVGAMVRATDKVRRLQTFARRGSLANEGVVDAFDDLAVYAVIGRVLFEEDQSPA